MESVFFLNEGERASFFQYLMQSFGCTYVCLWSYLPEPLPGSLEFKDGLYREENGLAPSSSTGITLARSRFNQYRQSVFILDNGRVPGLALKSGIGYIQLEEPDLQGFVSNVAQLHFYQEARIKSAVFMGCQAGEIELGMTIVDNQINMEMEMKKLFPQDFSSPSLSFDSTPENSPILFNTNQHQPPPPPTNSAILSIPIIASHQQAIQALSQIRNCQLPTIESEDEAMTNAMLAVLSSSSPGSSSSSYQPPPLPPPPQPAGQHKSNIIIPPGLKGQMPSAFKRYRPASPSTIPARVRRQNMLKRAVTFLMNLSLVQTTAQKHQIQGNNRPTANQLQHMIAERKRRERINDSFHTLRSLLPPGSKKDKASVLSSITEYLGSLKAQVEELKKRNQILEAQLPRKQEIIITDDKEEKEEEGGGGSSSSSSVVITHIPESTSEEARIVDLELKVRDARSNNGMIDIMIRILEFLKRVNNVSILSVQGETRIVAGSNTNTLHHITLRLKIEEGEWDESAFQEAVRRVVDGG